MAHTTEMDTNLQYDTSPGNSMPDTRHRKPSRRNRALAIIFVATSIIMKQQPATVTAFAPSPRISSQQRQPISPVPSRPVPTSLLLSTFDNPPSEMSEFQKRMRRIVTTPARRKNGDEKKLSKAPKNLKIVKTLDDYKKIIGKTDKLVVVRFYAPWCKACKAIAPAFYRLATKYPNVLFVDVPVTPENANLHQGLGVSSLPFGHLYDPTGGLVEEMKMSKRFFPAFARALKMYADGICDIEEYEEVQVKKLGGDNGDGVNSASP